MATVQGEKEASAVLCTEAESGSSAVQSKKLVHVAM